MLRQSLSVGVCNMKVWFSFSEENDDEKIEINGDYLSSNMTEKQKRQLKGNLFLIFVKEESTSLVLYKKPDGSKYRSNNLSNSVAFKLHFMGQSLFSGLSCGSDYQYH